MIISYGTYHVELAWHWDGGNDKKVENHLSLAGGIKEKVGGAVGLLTPTQPAEDV